MKRLEPTAVRERVHHAWRNVVPVLALLSGLASTAAAATRTVTGQIVYGTINNDILEFAPPTNIIFPSLPIPHVKVELNDGWTLPVGVSDITDANGRFSFTFHGTPNLTLVTKAENDYVAVKKHHGFGQNWFGDDVLKSHVDISGRIDYGTCLDGDTCDIGTVTVVSDPVDSFQTINGALTNYVSRAFYITSSAHAAGTNVEDVHGASLPGEKVRVRMGIQSTAWYYQIDNTIYLSNIDAITFWHEYGHFIEDKIGAFGLIPPYFSHSECSMITDGGAGNNNPNLCWSYLEGLATWYAALNASERYGGYSAMVQAFDQDNNLCTPEGDNDVERNQCDDQDVWDSDNDGDCTELLTPFASWTEPRAVESIVSNVLWDLIDDVQDPPNTTGVDEVADVTPEDVLAVVTAPMASHTTCSPTEQNSHPMGLVEFWDEWRRQHPGVVPDLYAAYAFNGANLGTTDDLTPPGPVTITSPSHVEGAWTRNRTVTLTLTDGPDDVSGSYFYFVEADQSAGSTASTTGPESFKSKQTVNGHEIEIAEGASNYIHANTLDMAAHVGTATTHFGPIHVDTVDPYMRTPFQVVPFRIDPTVPSADPTLVLGYPADIRWNSHDDLSGVASVRITFDDPFVGFSTELRNTSDEAGNYTWFVDDVPATPTGQLTITVTDLAGNLIVDTIPAPVVTPLAGPIGVGLGPDSDPCVDARVISADLDRDKRDDVVLVCRFNQSGHLYVFRGTAGGLALAQDFPWNPADDLAAADLDRDGDLDVVTVSWAPPGTATELEVLTNDGTGRLVDPGISRPLGAVDRKTVRVVHPYDLRRPTVAVFGVAAGNAPVILAFDAAAAFVTVALPGVDPVDGDWETSDLNGDGYVDLLALGTDAAGVDALTVFYGTSVSWARQNLQVYASVSRPDLDVADHDGDGKPDLFVMFDAGATGMTKLLRATPAGFTTVASATLPERRIARGDGFIVDTANDAQADVVAMGSNADDLVSGWYLRRDALVGLLQDTTIAAMRPLGDTDTAWGDFDADGDLDVFQVGDAAASFEIVRYENQLGTYIDQNDAPRPPTNLSASYDIVRGGYLFSWSAPAGGTDETPVAGFGYELRVGTTSSGVQVLSWAHPAGASQQGHRLDRFVRMPAGIFWYDVRTVDSGWKRSLPAGVKSTTP